MNKILLLALLACSAFALPNQRPIIGVYTQSDEDDQPRLSSGATFQTYIAASYIKFIEMSGAQVVPILAYSNQSYIVELLPKLNGVLFPGGGVEFNINNRWTSNANFILQYAIQQNDKGNVFPVWGTCLGIQLLGFLTNNYVSPLSAVRGETAVLNTIKFPTSDRGTLFSDMPDRLMTKLTTGNGITYFNHHFAILRSTYDSNTRLNSFWKVIGETTSSYNEKFVSVWQARKYPFFGVQFHPEKTIFEWKVFADKSYDSVQMTQIIANKFIDKARLSKNQYSSEADFEAANIYNYRTYPTTMSFTRIYLFNETKPVQDILSENFGSTVKIMNPESVLFEAVWGRETEKNLKSE